MSELLLDVLLDGFPTPIGKLARTSTGNTVFIYTPEYLVSGQAIPISLSLPLTEAPATDAASRAFFDNLLQERDAPLRSVMDQYGIARSDIAGLLYHLGKDCAGAISVVPEGAPPAKVPGDINLDYDVLNTQELLEIVMALHERKPLPHNRPDPSPLAGVQSKLSLLLIPKLGFALPKPHSGAPTTHILKVPDRNHRRDARLEQATMNLARLCGFETANAEAVEFGALEALVIQRFDRGRDRQGRIIRFHQEDFAQALGLPPSLKYERNGIPGRRFDVTSIRWILDQTADPAAARLSFIRATMFDLLTGNVDAHAKNHALLYLSGGRPRLAPRYDLVPTRLDRQLTDEFSYRIGGAERLQDITFSDALSFLNALGVSGKNAQRRVIDEALNSIVEPLDVLLEILQAEGLKGYADLIAANMRVLLPQLGLPVPAAAQQRDAFVPGGGGWLAS